MPVIHAALGFRLHTGWAAVVAVAERSAGIDVFMRKRIELLPDDGSIPRFVYHEAAEMERSGAQSLVKRAAAAAQKVARTGVGEILAELRGMNVAIRAAGITIGSTVPPDDLAKVLGAHPLIHAAEGALFHNAVAAACETCGLNVVAARERDLFGQAAAASGMETDRFRQALDRLRTTVLGPPWSADQKLATAAAVLALRTTAARRAGSPAPSRR